VALQAIVISRPDSWQQQPTWLLLTAVVAIGVHFSPKSKMPLQIGLQKEVPANNERQL
jgi:hypothetical protein